MGQGCSTSGELRVVTLARGACLVTRFIMSAFELRIQLSLRLGPANRTALCGQRVAGDAPNIGGTSTKRCSRLQVQGYCKH